jgi:hypothetical protein
MIKFQRPSVAVVAVLVAIDVRSHRTAKAEQTA